MEIGNAHCRPELGVCERTYRIAGNFSEIETLTIFACKHENAKVYSSGIWFNVVDTPMPLQPCTTILYGQRHLDRESMNHEN